MPSLYEGFGLTAAEAMAAGLPVVGTRVDGLSEIIEDGVTGYILQVGDSQGLANVLIELISNAEKIKTMGEKEEKKGCKNYFQSNTSFGQLFLYTSISLNVEGGSSFES